MGGSSVLCQWHDDHAIHTRFAGIGNAALIKDAHLQIEQLLSKHTAKVWLVDATEVASITIDARGPASEILGLLKRNGIRRVFCSLTSSPVRMFATSMLFGAGIRMHACATFAEALAMYDSASRDNIRA